MSIRPHRLRRRLRARVFDQLLHAEIKPDVAKRLMLDDDFADEVLESLAETHGAAGSFWLLLLSLPWAELLRIILDLWAKRPATESED